MEKPQPLFTDEEPEASIDLDATDHKLQREPENATKSIFNLTLNLSDEEHKSVEAKNYEESLKAEMKEWVHLWRNSLICAKKAKEKHPMIDHTILSAEDRAYLDKAPNLQNFLRGSAEFRQAAHLYLEKDFEEFLEMQKKLAHISEDRLHLLKENKIAENLANKSQKSQKEKAQE